MKREIKDYLLIILGTALYVVAVNLFVVPIGIYNGGLIGVAQIIRTMLIRYFNLSFNFDIAGIICSILNIPLFFLAFKSLTKHFAIGTLTSIALQTVLFSIIPIPATPIMPDMLTNIIIGAALSSIGTGMCLIGEACAGGTDILGVYASVHWKNITVGQITVIINSFIYLTCAIMFNIQTAIYSFAFAVICALVVDKVHLQNIDLSVMVFTRKPELISGILSGIRRGVTCWEGLGAYTQKDVKIFITVINRYELPALKDYLHKTDPNAFIIVYNNVGVSGGFEKRLTH